MSVTIAAELATQTPEKTATEIQTAVQAEVDKETGSAVPAITWDGTQSNEDRISNAAAIKTAIDTAVTGSGKLADGFTASKATDATFTITSEPTASATGTATITLTITKTADSTTGTVTISLTIPVTTA